MSESEFWDSTPRYLSARQKAKASDMHQSWEQTRFLAYVMLKTVDSKNKIRKVQDVCKFPWEQAEKKFVVQTIENLQKFSDEADEILRITHPEYYKKYMEAKLLEQNGSRGTGT